MTAQDRLQANLQWAKGQAESIIGSVTGSAEWTQAGESDIKEGASKDAATKEAAYNEAAVDKAKAGIQSGIAMVTGNQKTLSEQNQKFQEAELKQAANSDNPTSFIPNSTADAKQRLEGKLESAQGMLTGDIEKQKEGNMKDAKANLHDSANKFLGTSGAPENK